MSEKFDKPLEFLCLPPDPEDGDSGRCYEVTQLITLSYPEEIHVIEYSAFEQSQKLIEELEYSTGVHKRYAEHLEEEITRLEKHIEELEAERAPKKEEEFDFR